MAVTQLIIRVPMAYVDESKKDVVSLEKLISFDFLAENDNYLDLDWANLGLLKLAAKLPLRQYDAIRSVLDGDSIVNPMFPTGPEGYVVYSEITYLDPIQVEKISQILKRIDILKFMASLPSDETELKNFLKWQELPKNTYHYFAKHFKDLVDYVAGAAELKLALVTWWD